jgi:hypothetical protein
MLAFVASRNAPPGAVLPQVPMSERRLRLFLVACCRRQWDLFEDRLCREAVDVAERLANEAECARAQAAVNTVSDRVLFEAIAQSDPDEKRRKIIVFLTVKTAAGVCYPFDWLTHQETYCGRSWTFVPMHPRDRHIRAGHVSEQVVRVVEEHLGKEGFERRAQADLLRCIIGSPFRAKPTIPPAVLAFNDSCIPKLAASIYEERDFSQERLGVLADALEEAGMTDEEVLGHLRGLTAVHARGCWVIDCLTGRE